MIKAQAKTVHMIRALAMGRRGQVTLGREFGQKDQMCCGSIGVPGDEELFTTQAWTVIEGTGDSM